MNLEIIGDISDIETIAVGTSIREVERLRKIYSSGRWRKLKGIGKARFFDGTVDTHGLTPVVLCLFLIDQGLAGILTIS
jgi:hypothetical protein